MFKENLYRPFEILLREHKTFPLKEHQHSFFEAVYIASGEGSFRIYRQIPDACEFKYSAGSLFLIPPNTTHCFKVSKRSKFLFVRFTDHYIDEHLGNRVKHSLYLSYATPRILLEGMQGEVAEALFKLVESELAEGRGASETMLQNSADIVLSLASRILAVSPDAHVRGSDETEMHMLQYIQTHIHQPDELRLNALVKRFGLSKNYIGRYFKKHFQETLQQYITRNRMKRVEYLVANSLMSVKEIAYDMGFSDSCHLVKNFKKYSGMSPLKYRAKCNSRRA